MKLSEESLEFAKNHIIKYWDSDFFPKSEIFNYLWMIWPQIKNYLSNTDIKDLDTTIPKIFAAPKAKGGYRIVHKLEPINAIVYTALAYTVAEKIESARMPKDLKIACSYRICISADGTFFENRNCYTDFYDKSKELANNYKYVLKTDITDFYNQIYVHRLQNVIETADTSLFEISNEIEKFILKLNSNSSKGIPVGPAASIVFSEALMTDIDNFISNKGFEFSRYVDDIRIFSNDKNLLNKLLEELTTYLYEQHRLNLSSSKTELFEINDFLIKELNNPEEIEIQEQHKHLIEFAEEMTNLLGYDNSYIDELELADLPNEKQIAIKYKVLNDLLVQLVTTKKFDLGLVRHVLKQARIRRCRAILPIVLENFSFFTPVIREVCLYLETILNKETVEIYKEQFHSILNNLELMNLSFVRYWLNWLVIKKIDCFDKYYFQEFFSTQDCYWEIKKNIALKNITFINSLKINYDNYDIWTRLEILQGIKLLPIAERKAFLASRQNGMKKSEEFLIKAIGTIC